MKLLVILGKTILVFGLGYLLMRLMKKHSMATSTPMDFLITVVLGNILAQPIVSNRMDMTLIYAMAFAILHVISSKLTLWQPARRILSFTPTICINKGKIDEAALKRERISLPHLLAELRVKGYPNLADVEYVILEETGAISVIPKADKRPLEPADLGLKTVYTGLPVPVVIDGRIEEPGLRLLNKDRIWLLNLLNVFGINEKMLENVSLATVDGIGHLHLDFYENKMNPDS